MSPKVTVILYPKECSPMLNVAPNQPAQKESSEITRTAGLSISTRGLRKRTAFPNTGSCSNKWQLTWVSFT